MSETLTFAPLIPWPLLAGLAVLAIAAAVPGLGRGWTGLPRLLALLVLLATLGGPRLVEEQRRALPDIAVVVVDDSLSQTLTGRLAATEAALAEVRTRLERMRGLEVRVERLGAPANAANDEGTRLFATVERALADTPRRRLAGVIMITDGRVHDVPADLGRSLGAPLHVLLSGAPGERDRRLVPGKVPAFGLVGRSAVLGFMVEDRGAAGGEANVTLRLDGEPFTVVGVPLNREASIEIPLRHAGPNIVELEVEAGPGELSLANNRAAVSISGVRDRLKVLLVSGEPHAGERTWRNLAKADPAVDLVHFTILRPPEKDDRIPTRELSLITFPVRELFEDKLGEFDLVIFDRYRRRGVLASAYYRNLADYVRRGGALLLSVGPEFAEPGGLAQSALAQVLPALPTGRRLEGAFRPRPTETGTRHPVTAGLPGLGGGEPSWGGWMGQVEVEAGQGHTLLSGQAGRPLLVLDRVGDGRVGMILSDSVWLWARGWDGGGPHDELLRRLAHWLMKEPELEEAALSAEIAAGRLSVVRRSLDPGSVEVTVDAPDGTTRRLVLEDRGDGSALGRMTADQPGLWRVREDGESGRVAIAAAGSPSSLELAELTASAERLSPVSLATGGGVAWLSAGGVPDLRRVAPGAVAAGRGWMGLAERGDHVVEGLREVPLLPAWALLLLGLGGLIAAWWAEGRR